MVARVAVWAAGKVGGRNPVPSEPQGARRSSAGLAGVFFSYCVRGINVTDPHGGVRDPPSFSSSLDMSQDKPSVVLVVGAQASEGPQDTHFWA